MIKCDSCAWENPLHAAFCTNCGTELDRADMSISMDVSGSDELSLDGSESNLLVEAARKNAQRASAVADEAAEESTGAIDDSGGAFEETAGPAEDMNTDENQRTVDLDVDDSETHIGIGNRATLQLEPDMNMESSIPSELLETEIGAGKAEVESVAEPELERADAKAETDEPIPETPDSESAAAAQNDEFSYVAFDDGLPMDESIADASLQSLDIGIESLSLDDSLHLGPEFKEDMTEEEADSEPASDRIDVAEAAAPEMVAASGASESDPEPEIPERRAARLRLLAGGDASDALVDLTNAELILGRDSEIAAISDDLFVSPNHCAVRMSDGVVELSDLGSLNGTWLKINDMELLSDGQEIRLGGQCFTIQSVGTDDAHLSESEDGTQIMDGSQTSTGWDLVSQGRSCGAFRRGVPGYGLRIGRLAGNLVFEDDTELESLHAILLPNPNGVSIRDLNSYSGSWRRVDHPVSLTDGAEFLVGKTRIKLEL